MHLYMLWFCIYACKLMAEISAVWIWNLLLTSFGLSAKMKTVEIYIICMSFRRCCEYLRMWVFLCDLCSVLNTEKTCKGRLFALPFSIQNKWTVKSIRKFCTLSIHFLLIFYHYYPVLVIVFAVEYLVSM